MTKAQKTPPTWRIEQDDGRRVIHLQGAWTLIGVAHAPRGFSRRLRELAADGQDAAWNIEAVAEFDSAGALQLWRVWGWREPSELRASRTQRRLFAHFRNAEFDAAPPRLSVLEPLASISKALASIAREFAGIVLLLGQLIVDSLYCVRNPRAIPLRAVSATIYRAGAQGMALLAFIGAVTGMVLSWQAGDQLMQYGQSTAIVGLVGLAFLRELGPFVAGVIIVGRSGASFTAGISAMRITGEIDALHTFGASPTLRVAWPKIVGLAIAMPLLVVWTDFCGFVAAAVVSTVRLNVGYKMWLELFPAAVPWSDFIIGFGKGVLFGGLIGLVASYYGLSARADTQSLTANTIRSVVVNLALVLVVDGLLGLSMSGVGL